MANTPHPQPPRPPEIGRAFRPERTQLVGVGLLVLIVILALFGAFGTTEGRTSVEDGPVRMDLTYPERFRFKTIHGITVEVTNTSDGRLNAVIVRFDRDYLDAFSRVAFAPSRTRLTASAHEVELHDLEPGEMRPVSVEVQAEGYWGHAGFVEAVAGDASARAAIHTTVFP